MTDFKKPVKDFLCCVHPGMSRAGSKTQVPGRFPEAMPEAMPVVIYVRVNSSLSVCLACLSVRLCSFLDCPSYLANPPQQHSSQIPYPTNLIEHRTRYDTD